MSINYFIEQLQALAGQPDRWLPRHPTVHVAVNNAANKRPSAALIEVSGAPGLALLAGDLQADYAGRTLVLGRDVWPAGDRSTAKRALSDLVDAFLADLAVDLNEPLPEPVGYVGHDGFGGARVTRARSLLAKAVSRRGMGGERETSAKSPIMGDSILIK